MDYKYLAEWVTKNLDLTKKRRSIENVLRWDTQLVLTFKNNDDYLHLNLDSVNPFPFTAEVSHLSAYPFRPYNGFLQHLKGCLLRHIEMSEEDRIIYFTFEKKDIYSEIQSYRLAVELIPRKTNAILTKEELIVDCWKCLSLTDNNERIILPQQPYQPPSTAKYSRQDEKITFPLQLNEKGKIASIAISESNEHKFYHDINELFQALYFDVTLTDKLNRIKTSRMKTLFNQKSRCERKLEKIRKELENYSDGGEHKQKAELIKYNLNAIKKGMDKIIVTNYFLTPPSEIEIELLPEKSPLENMNIYFKKYRKSISGKEMKEKQIVTAEEELDEIDKKVFELENDDLLNLLASEKAISKKKGAQKGRQDKKKSRHLKLTIDDNWEIFIGRTARENDELTCRVAKLEDWWFHSRIYQGAHIILRNYGRLTPPEETIILCCRLAAWYSKAKHSSNVPVDYTQIRYVTKPHKSPPGYVTYKNQKTFFANPISLRDAAYKYSKNRSDDE